MATRLLINALRQYGKVWTKRFLRKVSVCNRTSEA